MPGAEIGILNTGDLRIGLSYTRFTSADLFGKSPESQNLGTLLTTKSGAPIDNSQIVNTMNIMSLSAEYAFTERLSIFGDIPYTIGYRYLPVLDGTGTVVLDRYVQHTEAMGDTSLMLKGWLLRPSLAEHFNLQLGLGVKVPTGKYNTLDQIEYYDPVAKKVALKVAAVDQSMQPGDGGWGIPAYLLAQIYLNQWLGLYAEGFYLLNPQNTNTVDSGHTGAARFLSIPDEYFARAGVGFSIPRLPALNISLGLRADGIPVNDLLGKSDGFRRPGYEFSFDPTLSYAFGKNLISLNVPYYFYKRKEASTADIAANAPAGLAAFASYEISASWIHQFSGL